MKTYISPLGFDTSHLIALIVRHGIGSGDRLILIRPMQNHEQAERAYEEVKGLVERIDQNIEIILVRVDHHDFSEMVITMVDLIKESAGIGPTPQKVHVNLSGGAREVLIALTTACVAGAEFISSATCYSDVERSLMPVVLPQIVSGPDRKEYLFLKDIMQNGPTSVSEIGNRLQISASSASRLCSQAETRQYVSVSVKGKNKIVKILPAGKIRIKLYSPLQQDEKGRE